MNLHIKYYIELDQIKDFPKYNRLRAEARFLIIKELERYLKRDEKAKGDKFERYKSEREFFIKHNIPETTMFRWMRDYKKYGIIGLVPKYGHNKSATKLPVKHCKRKYINKKSSIISTTIEIYVDKPLTCLTQLNDIIVKSNLIDTCLKSSASYYLKRIAALANRTTPINIKPPLTKQEIKILEKYRQSRHKNHHRKATAILMMNAGCSMLAIGMETNAPDTTIYKWLMSFKKNRISFIVPHPQHPKRKQEFEQLKTRVIDIIHKLPSLYGINRTTWTYGAIAEAYMCEYGVSLSESKISSVIKDTDYCWRRAKRVLTSPDPEYKEKVEQLLKTLEDLKEDERFFFIDEVGPYQVKKYGGKVLAQKDELLMLPEKQKSRGKIQFVAALEAVTNQLTWVFTPDKSAESMVNLFETIVQKYSNISKMYFTWDAISVHSSNTVKQWITAHNVTVKKPIINVVPLPSNAQFLNVIEAVFGGMKRAVICNSDYASVLDMQKAISLHFEDRNLFYKNNPKRAGDKIWDRQKFDFDKLAGGLFKKM